MNVWKFAAAKKLVRCEEENPAPAIVCSHGWYNNREMQDLNYVEYARRGFVVLSIDMYGHGNSENLPNGTWWEPENNANGMYDAVQMMATLPFVDASSIAEMAGKYDILGFLNLPTLA